MTLNFPATGDSKIVKFSYDCDVSDLTFSPSEQWVDVINKTSTSITISVLAREDTSSEDRTATVTVRIKGTETCSGDKKSLTIVQTGGGGDTCECSAVQYSAERFTWNGSTDRGSKYLTLEPPPILTCSITNITCSFKNNTGHFSASSPRDYTVVVSPYGNPPSNDEIFQDTLLISFDMGQPGEKSCPNAKEIPLAWGNAASNLDVNWEQDTNLNSGGEVRRRAATFVSDDSLFDVNEVTVNTPEWITVEVEETSTGEGNIYFTYGYTPISRMATAGVTYRAAAAHNGQKDFPQEGDPYQTGLAFAITKTELNACGGIEEKIGEYYYTDNFTYVQNTSFTCTTKPNWVSSVTFGIPDPSTKTGEIYATYGRNPGNTTRPWEGITITYSGYQDVIPRGETSMSQSVVTASVGACGDSENPGIAPNSCSEANFYHYDNPYVPGDLSYYYLEHNLTAYEQNYTLRTAADFCQYEIVPYTVNGVTYETRLPVSTISIDEVWKDVRVEIYDVVPDIVHNSACGLHHVEVHKGDTFALVKERHTSGNSSSTCACNCWFDGWNPNNGAYEIYGTQSTDLLAVYENGVLVSSEPEYDTFWLKATDCSHTYSSEHGWRELNFTVERNTGAGAYDRCAVIKVYPKIGGVYCTEECQNCERTAKCQNQRNCCLTDMIVQESVDCGSYETYFKLGIDGHAYSPRYIQTNSGEGLSNQVLYKYCWGPCNDINSNGTAGYVDAVDIYEGTVIRSTSSGNIKHTCNIGSYIGSVYATGNDYATYGRTAWTPTKEAAAIHGACITDVLFEAKNDGGQHRGYVYVSANGYTNTSTDPNNENRYRIRILVPYHKGENYWGTGTSDWKLPQEEYYTWYGPVSNGYEILNGHGIFCVIEQDGQNNG